MQTYMFKHLIWSRPGNTYFTIGIQWAAVGSFIVKDSWQAAKAWLFADRISKRF